MLGKGGDADVDAGRLFSPTYPGCYDYNGGGKPPPSTVPPVRHAGDLAGAEQAAYHHHSVQQGGGDKSTEDVRRGAAGECGEVRSGLRKTV